MDQLKTRGHCARTVTVVTTVESPCGARKGKDKCQKRKEVDFGELRRGFRAHGIHHMLESMGFGGGGAGGWDGMSDLVHQVQVATILVSSRELVLSALADCIQVTLSVVYPSLADKVNPFVAAAIERDVGAWERARLDTVGDFGAIVGDADAKKIHDGDPATVAKVGADRVWAMKAIQKLAFAAVHVAGTECYSTECESYSLNVQRSAIYCASSLMAFSERQGWPRAVATTMAMGVLCPVFRKTISAELLGAVFVQNPPGGVS